MIACKKKKWGEGGGVGARALHATFLNSKSPRIHGTKTQEKPLELIHKSVMYEKGLQKFDHHPYSCIASHCIAKSCLILSCLVMSCHVYVLQICIAASLASIHLTLHTKPSPLPGPNKIPYYYTGSDTSIVVVVVDPCSSASLCMYLQFYLSLSLSIYLIYRLYQKNPVIKMIYHSLL